MEKYGHRARNEIKLTERRPYEKTEWVEKWLKEFKSNSINTQNLLEKKTNFEAVCLG